MNKIILVDDNHFKGWEIAFKAMIKDIYSDLIKFECISFIDKTPKELEEELSNLFSKSNTDTLFILDNQLGLSLTGLEYLKKYSLPAIMNTADSIGFDAAKAGALYFMKKDNPESQMSNEKMKEMILIFHKTIITYFKLVPELLWIVMSKLGI